MSDEKRAVWVTYACAHDAHGVCEGFGYSLGLALLGYGFIDCECPCHARKKARWN